MANFDLNSYETVEERLKRFWAANPEARVITVNHTTDEDRRRSQWVVEARIYLTREDHLDNLPKATGWAYEVDGVGMANKTSALENCETSSIGRALANMNFSGTKRVTREEMEKVVRGPQRNWMNEAYVLADAGEINLLRMLYNEAKQNNASKQILEGIAALGQSGNENTGGIASGDTRTNPGTRGTQSTKPGKIANAAGNGKGQKG